MYFYVRSPGAFCSIYLCVYSPFCACRREQATSDCKHKKKKKKKKKIHQLVKGHFGPQVLAYHIFLTLLSSDIIYYYQLIISCFNFTNRPDFHFFLFLEIFCHKNWRPTTMYGPITLPTRCRAVFLRARFFYRTA